jgi:hypothetical protein
MLEIFDELLGIPAELTVGSDEVDMIEIGQILTKRDNYIAIWPEMNVMSGGSP